MMKSSAAAGKGMMVGSSPGRAEKLPEPGLGRLLGGGGRSRGRGGVARSSPMLVARSRSVGRPAGEEGEPSSPKVTCIGQVRIRRKKKRNATASKSKETLPTAAGGCRCLQRALLCGVFVGRKKVSGGRLWWRQWGLSLRSAKGGGCQQRKSIKKNEVDLMKPPIEIVGGGRRGGGVFESGREEYKDENDDDDEEEETRVFVSSATTTPPKNALMLMRCRSAPHNRASSLATNRFPDSPLPPSESESSPAEKEAGKKTDEREEEEEEEEEEGRKSSSGGEGRDEGSRPLVLTRCKSEPARRVAAPEASYCFWARQTATDGPRSRGAVPTITPTR